MVYGLFRYSKFAREFSRWSRGLTEQIFLSSLLSLSFEDEKALYRYRFIFGQLWGLYIADRFYACLFLSFLVLPCLPQTKSVQCGFKCVQGMV